MAELCSRAATERAAMETLRLRVRAPVPYPTRYGLKHSDVKGSQ